jgi:hypothetical protein
MTLSVFLVFHLLLAIAGLGVLHAMSFKGGSLAENLCWGFLAGFPVYSLLIFTLLVLGAPLSPPTAWLAVAVMLAPLIYSLIKNKPSIKLPERLAAFGAGLNTVWRSAPMAAKVFAVVVACILLFKFALAGWFIFNTPPYFDDAMNNWNIRAKNIFYEGGLFLDRSRTDVSFLGGKFAHYPFLHVAYKSALAAVLGGWHEGSLNAVHLLLPLAFALVFTCWAYRRSGSLFLSMLFPFMTVSIPLGFFHFISSYSDFTVGVFSALSVICFAEWFDKDDHGSLCAAGLFLFGAAFAKNDGLVIVWGSTTAVAVIFAVAWKSWKLILPSIIAFALLLPNTILRLIYNLPLNPLRDLDNLFFYRKGAASALWEAIFDYGHSGIFWFAVPVLLLFSMKQTFHNRSRVFIGSIILGMFGIIVFTFSFTGAASFSLNQMTVNRTLMFFTLPLIVYLFLLSRQSTQNAD